MIPSLFELCRIKPCISKRKKRCQNSLSETVNIKSTWLVEKYVENVENPHLAIYFASYYMIIAKKK